jgi:hypothetical protein
MENKIQLFEKKDVRSVWDEEQEKWWFSVLDVIAILTDQQDYKKVRNYWKWLKNKLKYEGNKLFSVTNEMVSDTKQLKNELVTNCYQLKLLAADGKYYKTDIAKNARLEIEQQGGKVISSQNAKQLGKRKEQNILTQN